MFLCSLRKLYLLSAQSRIKYWIFCNKVAVTRLTRPFIIYHQGGQRILAGGGEGEDDTVYGFKGKQKEISHHQKSVKGDYGKLTEN